MIDDLSKKVTKLRNNKFPTAKRQNFMFALKHLAWLLLFNSLVAYFNNFGLI